MIDAAQFCRTHGLDKEDADLVVWLVGQHLTMSHVAQKQDIGDPEVISRFAAVVGDEHHLTALYLLTHADIRGTSPKVWNGWKAKLLEDLFNATRRLLRGATPQQALGVDDRVDEARRQLRYHGLRPDIEKPFWKNLDQLYFLRHSPAEIAWHTRQLYHRPEPTAAVVKARLVESGDAIQVMVYTPDAPDLFKRICGSIARLGFTILDAKIHTTRHGYALDSFMVQNPEDASHYRDVISLIEHELADRLINPRGTERPSAGVCRASCGIFRSRRESTFGRTKAVATISCRFRRSIDPTCCMTLPSCSVRMAFPCIRQRSRPWASASKTPSWCRAAGCRTIRSCSR